MNLVNPFGFNTERKLSDISLLLLRLTFGGLMFINHGLGKFQNLIGEEPIKFADIFGMGMTASLGLAVFAEVLCALMIVFGLLTRLATIPLIITMLVAILVVHISDPFKKMELAIVYLVPYLILLWQGAGRYAIDALLNKK